MSYMRDWRGSRLDSFDPARDLPGCFGHFDASLLGLGNGAQVKEWGDRSGHGNAAIQATPAARGTYNAAALNGLGTVTFTAAQWMNSFVGGAGTFLARPQPFTFMALCKLRAAGSTAALRFPIAVASGAVASAGIGIQTQIAGTQDCWPYGWAGNGASVNTGGRAVNDGQWHVMVVRMSTASELIVVDGYVWSFVTSQVHGTNAATGAIILGASGTTGATPLDGDIAEAGVYNADLTAKQIEYLTRHLASKWGL